MNKSAKVVLARRRALVAGWPFGWFAKIGKDQNRAKDERKQQQFHRKLPEPRGGKPPA